MSVLVLPTVVVHADATAAPHGRPGWPEYLTAALTARGIAVTVSVFSHADRSLMGFADVVRGLAPVQDHRSVAVLAMSHADGRRTGMAPADAAHLAALGVRVLGALGARVVVVGPTGGGCPDGGQPAVGYGAYAKWHARTERAVLAALDGFGLVGVSYVSLAGLPRALTRDGVRPTPAGWRWAADRVADGIVAGLASP